MNAITITMPIPAKILSPNGSGHWADRGKARKQQRSDAFVYATSHIVGRPPEWTRAKLVIRWFAKDQARVPDLDNAIASIKGAIDGIADAGVIVNDRCIESIDVWRGTDSERPRVEITVEKIDGVIGA